MAKKANKKNPTLKELRKKGKSQPEDVHVASPTIIDEQNLVENRNDRDRPFGRSDQNDDEEEAESATSERSNSPNRSRSQSESSVSSNSSCQWPSGTIPVLPHTVNSITLDELWEYMEELKANKAMLYAFMMDEKQKLYISEDYSRAQNKATITRRMYTCWQLYLARNRSMMFQPNGKNPIFPQEGMCGTNNYRKECQEWLDVIIQEQDKLAKDQSYIRQTWRYENYRFDALYGKNSEKLRITHGHGCLEGRNRRDYEPIMQQELKEQSDEFNKNFRHTWFANSSFGPGVGSTTTAPATALPGPTLTCAAGSNPSHAAAATLPTLTCAAGTNPSYAAAVTGHTIVNTATSDMDILDILTIPNLESFKKQAVKRRALEIPTLLANFITVKATNYAKQLLLTQTFQGKSLWPGMAIPANAAEEQQGVDLMKQWTPEIFAENLLNIMKVAPRNIKAGSSRLQTLNAYLSRVRLDFSNGINAEAVQRFTQAMTEVGVSQKLNEFDAEFTLAALQTCIKQFVDESATPAANSGLKAVRFREALEQMRKEYRDVQNYHLKFYSYDAFVRDYCAKAMIRVHVKQEAAKMRVNEDEPHGGQNRHLERDRHAERDRQNERERPDRKRPRHEARNDRDNRGERDTPDDREDNREEQEPKPKCWGCGHPGPHKAEACYFKQHADFNNEHRPFAKSSMGRAYRALKPPQYQLSKRFTLAGGSNNDEPPRKENLANTSGKPFKKHKSERDHKRDKQCDKDYYRDRDHGNAGGNNKSSNKVCKSCSTCTSCDTCTMHRNVTENPCCNTCEYLNALRDKNAIPTDTIPATFTINDNHLTVNVLLDTGALGENDYMSTATAAWFESQGALLESKKLTRVCGAFANNKCQITSKVVMHKLTFNACDVNTNNIIHNETYDFIFKVVQNIEYDIIIGRKTITENNLWHLFPKGTSPTWTQVKTKRPKRKLSNSPNVERSSDADNENVTPGTPVFGNNYVTELAERRIVDDGVSPGQSVCLTQAPAPAIRVRSTTFHPAKQTSPKKPDRHVMATYGITELGSDDGYISDASINSEAERHQGQLGT